MPFNSTVQVRFSDVDSAGIVFYPRYFEMLNAAVEDWFAAELGLDFRQMHQVDRLGVPTVKLNVEFLSPSEMQDQLTITITPTDVGRASCAFSALFSGDGRDRLRADVVLVCMDLESKKARPWPDQVRRGLAAGLLPA